MNETQRIAWWRQFAKQHTQYQQFARTGKVTTRGGALGCTHEMLAFLARGWLGRVLTQDQVSAYAGYTKGQRDKGHGLYGHQVQQFCDRVGLPYRLAYEMPFREVMRRANQYGPVGVGVVYSEQPEWFGFTYKGTRADGRPNGYASPRAAAGKTQLVGFTGAHFDVVLGYHRVLNPNGTVNRRVVSCKDPNHGSAARPERPAYDDMTDAQFGRLYTAYKDKLGRPLYALVPTKAFVR